MALLDRMIAWWWFFPAFGIGLAVGYSGLRSDGKNVDQAGTERRGGFAAAGDDELESGSSAVISTVADPSSRLGTIDRIATAELEDLPDLCRELLVGDEAWLIMYPLMERWIELDAESGFEFFNNPAECPESIRGFAVMEYCGRWALVAPEKAADTLQRAGGRLSGTALARVFSTLAAHRPTVFFRIDARMNSGRGSSSRRLAARSLGSSDPRAAVAIFESMDTDSQSELAAHFAAGWAKQDPEGALEWARQLGEGSGGRLRAFEAIAGRMIHSEPERAAALFKEALAERKAILESGDGAGSRMPMNDYRWTDAARRLGESDPAAAIAWVTQHFPDEAWNMIGKMLPQGGTATVDVVAALPASVLDDGKLPGWPAASWRPIDMEGAIARLPRIADPVTRESAHAWLLGAQAASDPASAMASAAEVLSDPADRAYVLRRGMPTWAAEDLTAASQWLSTRAPGTDTDGAIMGLIDVAKFIEPDSALTWAGAITDNDTRLWGLSAIYTAWVQTDYEAARAALRAIELSDRDENTLRGRGVDLFR